MFSGFIKHKAFGLTVSDHSIEVLKLKKTAGGYKLKSYNRIFLKDETIKKGKILDQAVLEQKIEEAIDTAVPEKIKKDKVILSIPDSLVYFSNLKLDYRLKGEELKEATNQEAACLIPLDSDKVYSDFDVLKKQKDKKDIFYAAALKEDIKSYVEIFKNLELEPVSIIPESISLDFAFKEQIEEESVVLIADVGAGNTSIHVSEKNRLDFNFVIDKAGDSFNRALIESFDISWEEAEYIKRNQGVDPEKSEKRNREVLQNELDKITEEIGGAINFYEKKNGKQIDKILLVGGSSLMPGLLDYVGYKFEKPAELADPWRDIDAETLLQNEEYRDLIRKRLHPVFFSGVIGSAKKGLQRNCASRGVNLLPPDLRPNDEFKCIIKKKIKGFFNRK